MNKKEAESIDAMRHLCDLAGMDFDGFLEDMKAELKDRITSHLTPNATWFQGGKSLERYWRFLEQVTKHEWEYGDVSYWYGFLRGPSDVREEILPALRYQVLMRDESTCRRCGRKAPHVELEVDHILPWHRGGATVIDNLQTLCQECNIGKSDRFLEGGD